MVDELNPFANWVSNPQASITAATPATAATLDPALAADLPAGFKRVAEGNSMADLASHISGNPEVRVVPPVDTLDPSLFAVDDGYAVEVAAVPVLTRLDVRKPKKGEFFRVHPGLDYQQTLVLYEYQHGMDRVLYAVGREMTPHLRGLGKLVRLRLAMGRQGRAVHTSGAGAGDQLSGGQVGRHAPGDHRRRRNLLDVAEPGAVRRLRRVQGRGKNPRPRVA